MKFRKKPVVIDAIQWTGDNAEEVQTFLFNGHPYAADGWVKGQYVEIGTLEGLMVASIGDWIVRGVKGEHYPCKPDIFQATYGPASQPQQQASELTSLTLGPIKIGNLPTMNQDDYPDLGDWWVQLRIGPDNDEVLARVYGDTPQQACERAVLLANQKPQQIPEGLADILREASEIIAAIPTGSEPENIRFPIVDELAGFAAMLEAAPKVRGES